jgi:hypothetical protein
MDFNDNDIPLQCMDCDQLEDGIPAMTNHILENHPIYSKDEVDLLVRNMADEAYDLNDAENIWRSEEYRRNGFDPMNPPSDTDSYGDNDVF